MYLGDITFLELNCSNQNTNDGQDFFSHKMNLDGQLYAEMTKLGKVV